MIPVLDIGIGSGEFIERRGAGTYGTDVNPEANKWLASRDLLRTDFDEFTAFTMWDVIEHIDSPNNYFKRMPRNSLLFTSLPIFEYLTDVPASRHYKPGEHIYYFTFDGFIRYMRIYGFDYVSSDSRETIAGRDSITSFVFKKSLPDYRDMIGQYDKMHSSRHYGDSAHLYLADIAPHVIKSGAQNILDYGCGRSDLSAHFWSDGRRTIAKYDPAIPRYKELPEGKFDLVICCDVMEHILLRDVNRVFDEVGSKSNKVIFTISTKPSRAKLPDGTNAHVTLLTKSEWMRWIRERFGKAVEERNSIGDHALLVKTW